MRYFFTAVKNLTNRAKLNAGIAREHNNLTNRQMSEKIFGYSFEEINEAQQGKPLGKTIDPTKTEKKTATADDIATLEKHDVQGIMQMGFFGVLQRLRESKLIHPDTKYFCINYRDDFCKQQCSVCYQHEHKNDYSGGPDVVKLAGYVRRQPHGRIVSFSDLSALEKELEKMANRRHDNFHFYSNKADFIVGCFIGGGRNWTEARPNPDNLGGKYVFYKEYFCTESMLKELKKRHDEGEVFEITEYPQ